jgi:hypothetical protein
MNPSDEHTVIGEEKLVLAALIQLREEFAEVRREMRNDFGAISATFDRIDGHLKDISQIFAKTNQAPGQR